MKTLFVVPGGDQKKELLAIDASGRILKRAPTMINFDQDGAMTFATRDRSSVLSLDGEGNLKLVSLEDLAKITYSYPQKVQSLSRLPKTHADEFLVFDSSGLKTVSADRGRLRISGVTWPHDIGRYEALVLHGNSVQNLELTSEKEGTFFLRGTSLIYCSDRGSSWTFNPVCSVLLVDGAPPKDDRLCLAGKLTEDALFCLSSDRKRLEAYSVQSKTWLTVSADNFAAPAHEIETGKIVIHAQAFRQCSARVVIGYHEHINGGGGIESPGELVFDMASNRQIMKLRAGSVDPDPGFCTVEELISYSQARSKEDLNPDVNDTVTANDVTFANALEKILATAYSAAGYWLPKGKVP